MKIVYECGFLALCGKIKCVWQYVFNKFVSIFTYIITTVHFYLNTSDVNILPLVQHDCSTTHAMIKIINAFIPINFLLPQQSGIYLAILGYTCYTGIYLLYWNILVRRCVPFWCQLMVIPVCGDVAMPSSQPVSTDWPLQT